MGYIYIKLANIEIPNDFRVFCKEDSGYNAPYPISGATWTDYGLSEGQPNGIYSGGTTNLILSGSTFDFQYGTMYWVKIEEVDYPDRYVIKNIQTNDIIAYPFASPPAPSISVTPSRTPTRPVASVTRTPSRTLSTTPTITVTPSLGLSLTPTPTITPTLSPPSTISEIYFASIGSSSGILGVNNSLSRTFSITFTYQLIAEVDNVWSMGTNPVDSTTYLYISTNGGSSWDEKGSVTASIPGSGPPDESDYQIQTGTTTISGITDVTQVRVRIDYDCAEVQDLRRGNGFAVISSVTPDTGSAVVICNNEYYAGCGITPVLNCVGVSPTPSATQPSPTPTRTPTPLVIPIQVVNDSGSDTSIEDVTVGGISISSSMSPAFPYYPGDNGTGRSPYGVGTYSVAVYVGGSSSTNKYMTLVDSIGTSHCVNVPLGTSPGWFTFTNVNMNTTGVTITFYSSGTCPIPTPSVTRSVTPSRTPSTSFGSTPTASVSATRTPAPLSPTPTPSPTIWGYYVDVYYCAFPTCESYVGNTFIENTYYLQLGYYYIYDTNYIFYITGIAPTGGDVTNVSEPGYNSCNEACSNT